jgi:4-aminobutyrate aminotransferase-like enzyme
MALPPRYDEVLSVRLLRSASNMTLSYDEPVLMVAAKGSKMYDLDGYEWLDCANNVASVGHCNKEVRICLSCLESFTALLSQLHGMAIAVDTS